jgi:phenylacetate-CoA ligase
MGTKHSASPSQAEGNLCGDGGIEISIVAPCLNEEGNIPELVRRVDCVFTSKGLRGELILVDDGSTDRTVEIVSELMKEYPILRFERHARNLGMEAGWKTGVHAARGKFVCLIDADLQNPPEQVWRLYQEIVFSRADIVQGYRSSVGRLRDSRYLMSRGLNLLLNTTFGMRLRDNKSGFVIAHKEVLLDVLRHRLHYNYFQSLLAVSANSKGYSIREVETLFESRLAGKSFIQGMALGTITRTLADVCKGFYEFRLSTKRDNLLADFLKTHQPVTVEKAPALWRRAWFELYFLLTPLHKWMITRRAKLYYQELKKSQWLSPSDVKELQEMKLRALIQHAYRHVPYYHDRMRSLGLKPEDIQTIEDLQKLPLLSKQDVRQNLYFDLLSDNHDKSRIIRVSTSGSTGEPFTCFADQHQLEIRWASTLRSAEWTGYQFGDKQARLWHQTIGMSKLQVMREKIDAFLCRRLFIPAFEMSESSIQSFVDKLVKHQPTFIDGYAESFNFLASYLKTSELVGLRPKAIMSSAQILPEQSRKVIEESFGCKVFDKYGSREFSGIAYECEAHQGHHVIAESYIVEILKDGRPAKPGEMGEVVVTDLNNYCMPMIRYRLGDLAVAVDASKTCACGRGLPMIGQIEGRVQALIVGSSGRYIPGTFFAHLFKDYEYLIRQYLVEQVTPGEINLKIVKGLRFTVDEFDKVLSLLRDYLGRETIINVEFCDKIGMVRTGKQQGSISRLNLDFQKLRSDGEQSAPAELGAQ